MGGAPVRTILLRAEVEASPKPMSFTSHFVVVDADDCAVLTTTVDVLFGSGIYTDGFFLNSSRGNLDECTGGPNR